MTSIQQAACGANGQSGVGPSRPAGVDTRVPHWFGSTGDGPAEVLSIFGRPGERMQVRASGGDEPEPHKDPHQ